MNSVDPAKIQRQSYRLRSHQIGLPSIVPLAQFAWNTLGWAAWRFNSDTGTFHKISLLKRHYIYLNYKCFWVCVHFQFIKRMEKLNSFKDNTISVLVATDLAARGLDIANVKTVINFSMPMTFKHYIHRVGRTARAQNSGRLFSFDIKISNS